MMSTPSGRRVIAGLFLVLASACGPAATNPESAFLQAFEKAHREKNLDAAMALVYWEGVASDVKQNIAGSFKDSFAMQIEKLEMLAPPPNQVTQYTHQGKTFNTNLAVKKVFVIHFKPQAGVAQVHNTRYLIGENQGRYYITTATPAK